jgi:hypothetical protein
MGGKAFTDVHPVPRESIERVLHNFTRLMGIRDYRLLGSTGKKPVSGDIDIAVDSALDINQMLSRITGKLGKDSVNIRGFSMSQLYCRYQAAKHLNPVQIDLTFGSLPLLEFTYWAPSPEQSQYSGLHRTELIKAVAKSMGTTAVRDGEVVAKTGLTLLPNRGLMSTSRWRKPSMVGGFVKKMTEVPLDSWSSFISLFPELDYQAPDIITDPNIIARILFGMTDYHPDKLNSYEDVSMEIGKNQHLGYNLDLIWHLYADRISELGAPIPERMI